VPSASRTRPRVLLLPAPLLSVLLFVLWLLLVRAPGAGDVLLGALLALAIPVLTAPLRPLPVRVRRPGVILRLVRDVVIDVVIANVRVAAAVLRAGRALPHSAFVRVPLELRDGNGLAALAVITTITPGTVWCEMALDRSAILLHVLQVDDEAAFVGQFKARYERPLIEIFE
jgi:multicomponent K+:H+ antiporter subunit E